MITVITRQPIRDLYWDINYQDITVSSVKAFKAPYIVIYILHEYNTMGISNLNIENSTRVQGDD